MKTLARIVLFAFLAIHLSAADARATESPPNAITVKKAIQPTGDPLLFGVFIVFTTLAIYATIEFRKSRPPHVSAYQPSSLIILSSGKYHRYGESASDSHGGGTDQAPAMLDGVTVLVVRSFEGLSEAALHSLQSEGVKEGKAYLKRATPHPRQGTYRYIRDINPQLTDAKICKLFGLTPAPATASAES